MTLKEAYEYGQKRLIEAEVDDAVLDAWYLLEHVTGISRTLYFLRMNEEMNEQNLVQYKECLEIIYLECIKNLREGRERYEEDDNCAFSGFDHSMYGYCSLWLRSKGRGDCNNNY